MLYTVTVVCLLRKTSKWGEVENLFVDVSSPTKKKMVHNPNNTNDHNFLKLFPLHAQGLSRTSLQNYCYFYEFCAKFMRFLRVRTTYTVIIKFRKALETYFKSDSEATALWSNFCA